MFVAHIPFDEVITLEEPELTRRLELPNWWLEPDAAETLEALDDAPH